MTSAGSPSDLRHERTFALHNQTRALVHNLRMTIRPDRRLALLAMAKLAGVGGLVGLIVGVGMTLDGETKWSLLAGPAALAGLSASTLGLLLAITWWLLPGHVTYAVVDGFLTAHRGTRTRRRIAVERIANIDFDQHVAWTDLVFSGWFGYVSPLPALLVTMGATPNRWDPDNGAVIALPRILLCGVRQATAQAELQAALAASLHRP